MSGKDNNDNHDKVDRGDLEGKLREIQSQVDDAAATAKPAGVAVGGALAAGAVGLAFILGQHKAKKRTTIVEVRRV